MVSVSTSLSRVISSATSSSLITLFQSRGRRPAQRTRMRVRWAGRRPRLWKSVIRELEVAEEMTRDNDVLTLTMGVNYGGRAEGADAGKGGGPDVAAGRLGPKKGGIGR